MHVFLRIVIALAFIAFVDGAYSAEPFKLNTGEYAPFTGEFLPNGGPLTEVVKRAFGESGYGVTVTFLPWKRGYVEAVRGEYDGTFPYIRNASREADFLISAPYFTVTRNLFYLAKSDVNPDDLSTLKGKQVCVPLGYSLAPELSGMLERQELFVQTPAALTNCVDMLNKGRVDAFTSPADIGAAAIKNATVAVTEIILNKPIGKTEFCFLVPRANPKAQEILAAFDRGLLALKKSGDWGKIVKELTPPLK